MYLNRSATRAAPILLRSGTRTFGRTPRNIPRTLPAIAILLPRRAVHTESSTSSGNAGNFPPPGFNADQAKKPISKEEQKKSVDRSKVEIPEKLAIPTDEPTSSPKTQAHELASLTELATEKAATEDKEEKKLVKEEGKKLTIWEKVKREASHYWDGTKLLVVEVRISSKLALKMAAGYELTRREQRQVYYCMYNMF